MELWIRSQDKINLIKVYDIWIDDTDMVDQGYVSIMANSTFSFELGQYKTKERALEVLDEIQNLLQPKIIYTQKEPIETFELGVYKLKQDVDIKIQEVNRIVYEMPQD